MKKELYTANYCCCNKYATVFVPGEFFRLIKLFTNKQYSVFAAAKITMKKEFYTTNYCCCSKYARVFAYGEFFLTNKTLHEHTM